MVKLIESHALFRLCSLYTDFMRHIYFNLYVKPLKLLEAKKEAVNGKT